MLRVTYRKNGYGWEGVLKDEAGRVVWACGHIHRNRDISSGFAGKSAKSCAQGEVLGRIPGFTDAVRRAEA